MHRVNVLLHIRETHCSNNLQQIHITHCNMLENTSYTMQTMIYGRGCIHGRILHPHDAQIQYVIVSCKVHTLGGGDVVHLAALIPTHPPRGTHPP